MLTTEIVLSFYGIATLLALAPGPDNLFVLMQSALWGWRSGMIVILGLCTGVLAHTLLVAVGLAALLATSQTAFFVLKLIGAAYLLYLAWGAFRATPQSNIGQTSPRLSAGKLYRRGVIMSLSNPKLSLFFLAFLPQFASPTRGAIWPQIVSLGLLFILASILVFSLIAVFAGSIGERLQRSTRAQQLLNRTAGVVFLGLALRLLGEQR